MRSRINFFIFAAFFVGLIHIFSQGFGPLPGLGRLLSLSEGVYKNVKNDTFSDQQIALSQLSDSVDVIFDKHGVPHIFAKNRKDLFFTQGFITAKYRLWQMDLTTRAGGGEISEVMGPVTEEADRLFIQLGLRKAAKQSYELAQKDAELMEAVSSYTEGVNAYISRLEYKTWPLEYKIAQFKPQFFDERRVFQILTFMSFNLSSRSYDLPLTEVAKNLGWKRSVDLFPDFYSQEIDIKEYDSFFHNPSGESSNLKTKNYTSFQTSIEEFPEFLQPLQTDGSNSWLVPKELSASGKNILANDTHLGLRAPAVWFENRLYIENDLNVYGVSFPGAPTVVLGFNPDFAWGVTNGTIDVVDWFEVEFKSKDSKEYLLDGEWVLAEVERDELRVKGRPDEEIETLWTKFGPVVHREGKLGLAVRWTAHEPSNEVRSFFDLNWAKSVEDGKRILKEYKTPIQNFSLADKNSVAIVTAGTFPKRPYGFGRVVENGRFNANNWDGLLNGPVELTSEIKNKRFGYSANQRPLGSDFPFYLGWDFEQPFRGQRIKARLEKNEKLTLQDMMSMQTEAFNQLAFHFFQLFDREQLRKSIERSALEKFSVILNWDFIDDAESEASTLFYSWFESIEDEFWKEELSFQSKKFFPKKSRTLIELKNKSSKDFKEFEAFLAKTFSQTLDRLNDELKEPDEWKWGNFQPTQFGHITKFPGLSGPEISPSGSRYSLSANRGEHGGAWRLVVQMSDPVVAWSRIPGSVEGNPLNPSYNSGFKEWGEGKYQDVQFLLKDEVLKNSKAHIKLVPK